jgi:integrase
MFTIDQIDAPAEAVDERWRAMILTAAWVGLRISELAALRRHRVDLDLGVITVAEPVNQRRASGR